MRNLDRALQLHGFDSSEVWAQAQANIDQHGNEGEELEPTTYRWGFIEGLMMAPLLKDGKPGVAGGTLAAMFGAFSTIVCVVALLAVGVLHVG